MGEATETRRRSSRWTRARAKRELAAWARSGMTMVEYAKARGLSVKRLWSWNGRLKAEGWRPAEGDALEGPVFAPVRVVGVGPEPWCGFDVVMENGLMVRVPARFEEGALRRLLDVVMSC